MQGIYFYPCYNSQVDDEPREDGGPHYRFAYQDPTAFTRALLYRCNIISVDCSSGIVIPPSLLFLWLISSIGEPPKDPVTGYALERPDDMVLLGVLPGAINRAQFEGDDHTPKDYFERSKKAPILVPSLSPFSSVFNRVGALGFPHYEVHPFTFIERAGPASEILPDLLTKSHSAKYFAVCLSLLSPLKFC